MGWLIALGLLVLLAVIPLGVSGVYDQNGPVICLKIGPTSIPLYPADPKKADKQKGKKKKDQPEKPKSEQQSHPQEKKGGSLSDFWPLVEIAVDFLGDLRRKLRVKVLELNLTLAGDDPCDLAVNYGRAWAAVGNIMPQLERLFVIKKRNIDVQCDFVDNRTRIYVRLDVSITLGRLLGLATRYGIRVLRVFLKKTKNNKGGAIK